MPWYEVLDKEISDYLPDLKVLKEEPMAAHTSFRIGGPARRMAFPATLEEMVLLVNFARDCGAQPLIIGNGTNLLVTDQGIDRLVINTRHMDLLEQDGGKNEIKAGAGVSLARLALFAMENGLSGLEFAHGIPGSVGGGVTMNAGAYGGELKDVLSGAGILFPDSGVRYLNTDELRLSYRHSILTDCPDAVVLYAVFRLQNGKKDIIKSKMDELMVRRKESQPLEYPSAGSFFKRPEGHFAGALIEQNGGKGMQVGDARISQKHAGFLINTGNATFGDVISLMKKIQKIVWEKDGVMLEPEVRIIS